MHFCHQKPDTACETVPLKNCLSIRKSMRKAEKLQKDVLYIKYGTYYALIKLKVFSFIAQM